MVPSARFESSDPATEESVLSCVSVTKTYQRGRGSGSLLSSGSKTTTVTALDSVNLEVAPGEIVGIKGPSGSGKSTLLHLLAGLDVPTEGTVRINGEDISQLSDRERIRLRRTTVGMVFQRFHLLAALSARANVAVPMIEAGISRSKRKARGKELLDAVGLSDRATHHPGELSGGEQQRVAIARALALDPAIVVADEPTGELDTETGEQILSLLREIAGENRAVILASHDEAALEIADRQIELRDGKRIDES